MYQTREQDKTPDPDLKTEISDLSDRKFKTTLIKLLTKVKTKCEFQQRDRKYFKTTKQYNH